MMSGAVARLGRAFITLKALNKIAQGKRAARHPGIKIRKRIRSLEGAAEATCGFIPSENR